MFRRSRSKLTDKQGAGAPSVANLSPAEQFAAAWPRVPNGYLEAVRVKYVGIVDAHAAGADSFEFDFWIGALAMNALTAAPTTSPDSDFEVWISDVIGALGPNGEVVRQPFFEKLKAVRESLRTA